MSNKIAGPLGLWNFPLLNLLLSFVDSKRTTTPSNIPQPIIPPRIATSTNVEVWEWLDWRGQTRTITAHRTVEAEQ